MLLDAWLKVPEDITLDKEALRAWASFLMHYGSCSLTTKEEQGFRNQCWRRDWEEKETPQTVPGSEEKGSCACRAYVLPKFFFFFLILVCSWHKGYIQAPFHMPCEVWIGCVNCEQMMEPLRQTPAVRGGRPGEVFSCGLGDAGLCGRCAALDIGRAGFHGTERCCEGVQGTFLSRAWSRLNGPAWLRFKAEAREGIFCTSRRAVSWKSSFCARTVSHVCVAQADLWP